MDPEFKVNTISVENQIPEKKIIFLLSPQFSPVPRVKLLGLRTWVRMGAQACVLEGVCQEGHSS